MPQRLAPVRAALLALVVFLVTAGFVGMHVLAAHEAHAAAPAHGTESAAPAVGASPVERTTSEHADAMGLAEAWPAQARGPAEAGHARVQGLAEARPADAACHAGYPPSGVAHTTDCTPAPGVPAPVPPAVVVLARSDARPLGSPDGPPSALAAPRAPNLIALSISRT
ncbi:hypothetical protein SPF06_13445 [Sinomonas sp. JGH33]|uniref:Uncharacterized protein n=1 Tax=Sinomonas terricola TaxID=3110330 RepID=A0ABU5T7R4_9MICC|nr:hypothetical protein [Sinomonas sp. JGH33]MEA5455733.1 hypothetical protein [Sinomonas sp. JGH33]